MDEFDDAREVVQSLRQEYAACEASDYIEGMTAGGHTSAPTMPTEDRRIAAT